MRAWLCADFVNSTNGATWWYKDARQGRKTTRRRILPEKFRKIFARKQIMCVEYSDITEADERDIFRVSLRFWI